MQNRGIILVLVAMLLFSCAPEALREAENVVAQADSLWKGGQMYADSARLAQSYTTLHDWRYVCADEYAHACYHYGRLLREKDNPVEAIECFINATHSRTRDHHILGRVYSNMGDIAHLAGEYSLSCNMFEQAAKVFLQDIDTLAYNHAMYRVAYAKACLAETDSCYAILHIIESSDKQDDRLRACCCIAHARTCLMHEDYDSTILYAQKALSYWPNESSSLTMVAQAYSYLGVKDSATNYALRIIESTPSSSELVNALYILTNDDESKDIEAVRESAANRSDIQKQIELNRAKLSQASQLLEQDLHRKPNLAWLYAVGVTLIIIGFVVFIYIHKKHRQRTLLTQQVNELEEQHEQIVQEHSEYIDKLMAQVEETCAMLKQSPDLTKDLSWNDFESMCHFVDQQFCMIASKLRKKYILNETEVRLCILVLLNLNRKQISETLPYSLNSVGKLKDHTAKLLGTTGKNLRDFLLNMAVEG